MEIRIISGRDKNIDPNVPLVNTTSRSKEGWSKGLSPFFLGPVQLFDGTFAQNVENAWQYAKVYEQHLDPEGNPSPEYFHWAREGFLNPKAVRFPMGPGARPAYSFWDGLHLGYVPARKVIYAPLYAAAVVHTDAFLRLEEMYRTLPRMYLWDFDGYDYLAKGMSLTQVMNNAELKMGHSFVLAMMLKREFPEGWASEAVQAQLARLPEVRAERAALALATRNAALATAEKKRQQRAQKKK